MNLLRQGPRRSSLAGDGWAEILYPGKQLGLRLDLVELPERLVHAVRTYRGWRGLWHWCGLQQTFATADPLGRVRWSLHEHLETLGVPTNAQQDPRVRAEAAAEIDALMKMEIAVYHPSGTVRLRGSVATVSLRGERAVGDSWSLERLEVYPHPIFLEGVRRADGSRARLWAPSAEGLPRLGAERFVHALSLGMVLPIRWQWASQAPVTLTGAQALEAAGIDLPKRANGRSWSTFVRCVEVLERVGALGAARWLSAVEQETLDGRCVFAPPDDLALAEPFRG